MTFAPGDGMIRPMVQTRSEETRTKVLDAARALMMEKGVDTLTMKDLQERSGVSNGSIFHHFGSKDGVVAQVFVAERRAYLGEVQRAVLAHDGDPCEALGEGARAALLYQARDPERFLRLVLDFTDSEWFREHGAIWREVAAEMERPVVAWAASHVAAGRFPDVPGAFLQSFMMGGTERLTSSFLMNRLESSPAQFADEAARFVTAGARALLPGG